MAEKQIDTVTIRFNAPDQDLMEEFYRQIQASGSGNKSGFAKELLTRSLYHADPTQNATIQALLRDVKDATSEIQSDLTNSTVLYLSLVYIQWCQAVMLFPVVKACEFVADEALLSLVNDLRGSTASAVAF